MQALESGASNIIIGIGGSATNDGGAGMMQALGAKLRDANGADIGYGGGSLHCLSDIDISDLDPRLKLCAIRVACDVSNPLIGDNGASRIFGPQKGATEENIVELDRNLAHYADIIKKSLNVDVKAAPGRRGRRYGGGVNGFSRCGTTQRDRNCHGGTEPEEHIHDCTLVVTGEGRIDSQSIRGKVPIGVANVAKNIISQ